MACQDPRRLALFGPNAATPYTEFSEKRKVKEDEDRKIFDGDSDYRLPRNHVPTEAPDTTGVSEIASMDTFLPKSNVGYRLLLKMGWKEGTGAGKQGRGIVEPVRVEANEFSMGLGKQGEIDYFTNPELIARPQLESEAQLNETEEQRRKREEKVDKEMAIKTEIATTLREFYCELCDKQYKKVKEFENHLSSYDHHHKKRLKDLVDQQRSENSVEKEKLRQKEDKRREKEMERMAAAIAAAQTNIKPPEPPAEAVNLESGQSFSFGFGLSAPKPKAGARPATAVSGLRGPPAKKQALAAFSLDDDDE
eukprot:GILJ01008453.1.p1 GENE.GILJ01008453.1~~GILJ01008453.1.p1  ORF type:complete len:308 (+),score=59.44 GILJ01008453.1:60-983(+)